MWGVLIYQRLLAPRSSPPPLFTTPVTHIHTNTDHTESGICTLGNLRWTVHQTLYITPDQTGGGWWGGSYSSPLFSLQLQEDPAAWTVVARLPHPLQLRGPRYSGACKNPKRHQTTPMETYLILCGGRSIHSYLHRQQRSVLKRTGPPSKSFMSKYILTA